MALAGKQLADGQLPTTIGDLFTATQITYIKSIILVNTHTANVTTNLYLLPSGGTARRIVPKDLTLSASDTLFFNEPTTLDSGDKIQGDASVVSVVDYIISGGEG